MGLYGVRAVDPPESCEEHVYEGGVTFPKRSCPACIDAAEAAREFWEDSLFESMRDCRD